MARMEEFVRGRSLPVVVVAVVVLVVVEMVEMVVTEVGCFGEEEDGGWW